MRYMIIIGLSAILLAFLPNTRQHNAAEAAQSIDRSGKSNQQNDVMVIEKRWFHKVNVPKITHRSPRKCTDRSNSTYTLICQTRKDGYCVRLRQCCAEEELCLGKNCSSLENCPGSIQTRCMVRMCGESHTCRRDNECPSLMNCERGRCAMRNNSKIRSGNIEQAETILAKKRFTQEKKLLRKLRKKAQITRSHPAPGSQKSSPAKTNQTTEQKSTESLIKYTVAKVEPTSTMHQTTPLSETNHPTTEVAPSREKKSVYIHPLSSSLSSALPRLNGSMAEKSTKPFERPTLTKAISTTTALNETSGTATEVSPSRRRKSIYIRNISHPFGFGLQSIPLPKSNESTDKESTESSEVISTSTLHPTTATADFAPRREIKSVHVQRIKNHSEFDSTSIPPSKANESTEKESTEPSKVLPTSTLHPTTATADLASRREIKSVHEQQITNRPGFGSLRIPLSQSNESTEKESTESSKAIPASTLHPKTAANETNETMTDLAPRREIKSVHAQQTKNHSEFDSRSIPPQKSNKSTEKESTESSKAIPTSTLHPKTAANETNETTTDFALRREIKSVHEQQITNHSEFDSRSIPPQKSNKSTEKESTESSKAIPTSTLHPKTAANETNETTTDFALRREIKSVHEQQITNHPEFDSRSIPPQKSNKSTEKESTESSKVIPTSTLHPTNASNETNETTTDFALRRENKSVHAQQIKNHSRFSSLSIPLSKSNEPAEKESTESSKVIPTSTLHPTTASNETNETTTDFALRREIKSVHVQQTKNHSEFDSRSIAPQKSNKSTEKESTESSKAIPTSTLHPKTAANETNETTTDFALRREIKSVHAQQIKNHSGFSSLSFPLSKSNEPTEKESTESSKVIPTSTLHPTTATNKTNDKTADLASTREIKSVHEQQITNRPGSGSLSIPLSKSNEPAEKESTESSKVIPTSTLHPTTASNETNETTTDFALRREIKSVHVQQTKNHSEFDSRSIPPQKSNKSTEKGSTESSKAIPTSNRHATIASNETNGKTADLASRREIKSVHEQEITNRPGFGSLSIPLSKSNKSTEKESTESSKAIPTFTLHPTTATNKTNDKTADLASTREIKSVHEQQITNRPGSGSFSIPLSKSNEPTEKESAEPFEVIPGSWHPTTALDENNEATPDFET